MNEYDSLRVERILASRGYVQTDDIERADVVFLNTCSVREKPVQKVYSLLGRLRKYKTRNPTLKVIVAGCVAQQLGSHLLERFDHVNLVMGTRAIPSIGRLLEEIERSGRRMTFIPEEGEDETYSDLLHDSPFVASDVTAPVTIMQGCNNFCTYCIVPYVRGREKSRPSRDILQEIKLLVAGGAREILLLGQNVNSYGRGLDEDISFSELLRRIGEETDVLRVRFTTSHPKDLTHDLIRCFSDLHYLCSCLHLPFQSGSDRVLKLMNRGYSADQYIEKIERLREACPEIGLSTDVMVGFPGETEEDFSKTMELLERVQFDNAFSFRYSDRPFARASEFSDKVPDGVKSRRLMELQALQAAITLRKNESEIGAVREILVEGPSKTSATHLTGRTQQNRIVNFEGPKNLIGRIVPVKIGAAYSHSLGGELLEST